MQNNLHQQLSDARILVLGGRGFLGARLVRKLCHWNITPHLLLRPTKEQSRIQDLSSRYISHTGDLTELCTLQNIINEIKPDIIFHAAGHGSHKGQNKSDALFKNNVLAAHNLLTATEQHPQCRLIYSGTSLEQGIKKHPQVEDDANDPVTYYAAVKTAASVLIKQAARHERRPITILNPFAIYGIGEPASRLIPTAIRAGIERKKLSLTQPGFVRDFVFVDDVVEAYLLAAVTDKAIGETINIAGGTPVKNEEVVRCIENHLGYQIEKQVGSHPAKKTDSNYWCADISKARNLLGWTPTHTLAQGIELTINWYLKNGF